MKFSLFVQYDVSPAPAWTDLPEPSRSVARQSFAAEVATLAAQLGEQETDDPDGFLAATLAAAPGDWATGPAAGAGVRYVYDERTKSWICVYDLDLLRGGAALVVDLDVDGVALQARYRVGYTHTSDPLA
mgnify:CR=1 FL=1